MLGVLELECLALQVLLLKVVVVLLQMIAVELLLVLLQVLARWHVGNRNWHLLLLWQLVPGLSGLAAMWVPLASLQRAPLLLLLLPQQQGQLVKLFFPWRTAVC